MNPSRLFQRKATSKASSKVFCAFTARKTVCTGRGKRKVNPRPANLERHCSADREKMLGTNEDQEKTKQRGFERDSNLQVGMIATAVIICATFLLCKV